mmetsp:Transcript_34097/g.54865  ORF Transcript_34097/g.54865 Transcript_34097/m.54865 type:complete len:623 (-) Transcript_34097:297-2165(-)|eukprot:CAMPEP_0115081604 /NCGR_PEP_ID=MMETSP0227-20121206/19377_1 /TAXON_ID=89957 /ORGANISM="Polarella glacialis, Strain CCMP 1383" /LENGTH=622 /DNA_ID=CAMNT_0002469479 /DNA_START=58 /DNA_END=1926 /DNA_ORIENTATION=-
MRCGSMDYGWYGLAGFFAVVFAVLSVVGFADLLHLWNWDNWRHLYASQLVALTCGLIFAVFLAKVLATAVHVCATCWKLHKYRKLIQTVLQDQEQGGLASGQRGGEVRKVLICHASVGAGHKRAAEALAATIHRLDSSVEVRVVDLMQTPYADRTLIYFYKDWYLRLVGGETFCGQIGTLCVGFFFDRANSVHNSFTGGGTVQRRITQSFLLNFLQLVCDFNPDVVVHTHFLAPELLASLRRKHGLKVPHVTVVTDMDVHAWWYQQPTDHYFVPREMAKHQLTSDGVPVGDVTISGIPIMPQFLDTLTAIEPLDTSQRRRRLLSQMDAYLNPELFTDGHRPLVVQMSTGRSVQDVFEGLLLLETPISLVVVCGRQADVSSKLEQVKIPSRHRVSLLGFTGCIHELLAVADIVVTKPGGLITSEALACGLMMVVVDPYPGQEERNASMLLEEGAGIWIWDYRDMRPKLDKVLTAPPSSRASLADYKQNARRIARPDAAFKVSKYVLSSKPFERMMRDDSEQAEASFREDSGLLPPSSSHTSSYSERSHNLRAPQRAPTFLELAFEEETPKHRRSVTAPPRMTMQVLDLMQAMDSKVAPHLEDNEEESDEDDSDEEEDGHNGQV